MSDKYNSFLAGEYDVMTEFEGFSKPDFAYPDEDAGELDAFEYLRGQVSGLVKILKEHIKEGWRNHER